LSWHHDDRKKAGPEESDEMTQILKPEVQVKSAQLRQHAKVNCLQSSSSLPSLLSPIHHPIQAIKQVGRQQLDTSSELSGLTKDDGDGDKATPSSEEGDDDDGPVMPKAIIPGPPAQDEGLLDVLSLLLCMNNWTYKRMRPMDAEQDGDARRRQSELCICHRTGLTARQIAPRG